MSTSRKGKQLDATALRARRVNRNPDGSARAASLLGCFICGLLIFSVPIRAQASESISPEVYEVTTETGMPHLEENLRYAITREKRCLSQQELFFAFPILGHQSLRGCKLDNESPHEGGVSYVLICDSGHGTTGSARWQLGADLIKGTLDVKLGGKNMTFYQHITAKPLGGCMSEAK
jgi:hypothetical protein